MTPRELNKLSTRRLIYRQFTKKTCERCTRIISGPLIPRPSTSRAIRWSSRRLGKKATSLLGTKRGSFTCLSTRKKSTSSPRSGSISRTKAKALKSCRFLYPRRLTADARKAEHGQAVDLGPEEEKSGDQNRPSGAVGDQYDNSALERVRGRVKKANFRLM
jgi:hypothetical protein